MIELFAPYVTELLTVLLQIVLLFVFFWVHQLKRKAEHYIADRNLQLLGKEAFAFAETVFNHLKGEEKYNAALQYLERQAAARGIPLTADKARGVIEKAWNEAQNLTGEALVLEQVAVEGNVDEMAGVFKKMAQAARSKGL